MDASQWNGDEYRELGGEMKSEAGLFWRSYHMAVRTGCVSEYLELYRSIGRFSALVQQADRMEAARLKESA